MAHDIPALVETVRTFVREQLYPLEKRFLGGPLRDLMPVLEERRQQVRKLGLWAPHIPRSRPRCRASRSPTPPPCA